MFHQHQRGWILIICLLLILSITQDAPRHARASSSLLRSGSRGEEVRQLQAALAELGYSLGPIDGIFGRQTELALRNYQRDRGIIVDGLAGAQTMSMLREDLKTKPVEVDKGHMHVVRPGETLHSIASRHGLTWADLMDYNHLHNPNRVFVDQALFIPGPGWTPTPATMPQELPKSEIPVQVPSPREHRGAVALTFNDSPHPQYTLAILDILEEHDVLATFFVIGSLAQGNPDLVRLIAQRGHAVENHSHNHRNVRGQDLATIETEITQASHIVKDITGKPTQLFRPPGGGFDLNVRLATANTGHRLVMWTNISAQTPFNGSTEELVRRIVDHAYDGCILMLHDGSTQTLDALPAIITGIKAQGFSFVLLNDHP